MGEGLNDHEIIDVFEEDDGESKLPLLMKVL